MTHADVQAIRRRCRSAGTQCARGGVDGPNRGEREDSRVAGTRVGIQVAVSCSRSMRIVQVVWRFCRRRAAATSIRPHSVLLLNLTLEQRAEGVAGKSFALGGRHILVENSVMRSDVLAVLLSVARACAELAHRLMDLGHI